MYFTTEKERNIMMKINYQTEILENYVNKEKSSKKIENKLMTLIEENKKEIRKMNTYSDKKTQTKGKRDSVKGPQDLLHDNNSTSSLYSPDHQRLV